MVHAFEVLPCLLPETVHELGAGRAQAIVELPTCGLHRGTTRVTWHDKRRLTSKSPMTVLPSTCEVWDLTALCKHAVHLRCSPDRGYNAAEHATESNHVADVSQPITHQGREQSGSMPSLALEGCASQLSEDEFWPRRLLQTQPSPALCSRTLGKALPPARCAAAPDEQHWLRWSELKLWADDFVSQRNFLKRSIKKLKVAKHFWWDSVGGLESRQQG